MTIVIIDYKMLIISPTAVLINLFINEVYIKKRDLVFMLLSLTLFFTAINCSVSINVDNYKTKYTVANPVFSLAKGQYFGSQTVTISSETTEAKIIYTLDGTEPTESVGITYNGSVVITETTTLKAVAHKDGYTRSGITAEQYSIIIWKGTLATAPATPVAGWAYYNSTDKKSYIYDGTAWQILAQDGKDGTGVTQDNGLVTINVTEAGTLIDLLYNQTSNNIKITTAEGVLLNTSDVEQIRRYALVTKDLSIDIKDTKYIEGVIFDFRNAVFLRKIVLPEYLMTIDASAFYGCSSLRNITIPNGVASIGDYAFKACYSLSNITIPTNVTSIGIEAFKDCSSLSSVTINAATPPSLGSSVFYGVNASLQIKVPSGSVDTYKAASGWSVYADKIVSQ